MNFAHVFCFQCKRIVRRKSTLACFLLLPLLVLLLGLYMPKDRSGETIQVGVYLPLDSPAGDIFWQAIGVYENQQGYTLRFIPAASSSQLADMVASGVWECGYLLPQDFRARLQAEDYYRLVTRIDAPSTTLAILINEAMSAAILDICAQDIAAAYLMQTGILPGEVDTPHAGLLDILAPQFFDGKRLIHAETQFVDDTGSAGSGDGPSGGGNSNSNNNSNGNGNGNGGINPMLPPLIRGLVAIFLFLFSCLCALWFIGDSRTGFYRRLSPYIKPGILSSAYFCAVALFAGCGGLLALLLAGFFLPGFFASFLVELLCLLAYILYLSLISYFLASVFRDTSFLAAALPFLLIATLLFCPIVIDLALYLPFVGIPAAALPPTFYLRAISSLAVAADGAHLASALRGFIGYLPAGAALYVLARLCRLRHRS